MNIINKIVHADAEGLRIDAVTQIVLQASSAVMLTGEA